MQTGKIRRQFRAEPHQFTANRVLEAQYMGVEGLSAKVLQGRLGGFRQQGSLAAEAWPVNVIAEEGVADRGQMHPNLVRAPGFQRAGQ